MSGPVLLYCRVGVEFDQTSGVPDYEYPALDQGTIMAELEKKYPDFEKRTGWRLDSEYKEEIPEALAKEVHTIHICFEVCIQH